MLLLSSTAQLADEALILKTWNEEVHSLTTSDEREEFFLKVKDITSFTGYVQAVEKTIKDSNKSSRLLRVAKWIRPIFRTMNMIAPLVRDFAPIDPRISGIVLGAISNALAVSTKFVDYQKSLVGQIAKMAFKLDLITQYGDSIFPKDLDLNRSMIKLYAVILKFCIDASRLFIDDLGKKKVSVLRLGKSTWESFESKFGYIDKEFDSRLEDLKLAIGLCRDRRLSYQQDLLVDLSNQTKSLEQEHNRLRLMDQAKQLEAQRSKSYVLLPNFYSTDFVL